MSQRSQSPAEAQIATELAGTPTESSHSDSQPVQQPAQQQEGSQSTQEFHSPQIPLPAGINILSGPPSRSSSQLSGEILELRRKRRRREGLGPIPIMSTDTPRPQRAGAMYTSQETAQYETNAREYINQCAFMFNLMDTPLPNITHAADPADADNEAQRAVYVGELLNECQQWENVTKALKSKINADIS